LIPLTNMINREDLGYEIDCKNRISHLFYMDDLKTFSKSEEQQRQILHIVKTFSDDIKMEFGLDKCATVVFKNGKRVKSQNIQLDGASIKNLEQDEVYKYLGVDEGDGMDHHAMRARIVKEYYRRVR
jgi:Reverse transcriptase (RNA-dependent DNA polymerase)